MKIIHTHWNKNNRSVYFYFFLIFIIFKAIHKAFFTFNKFLGLDKFFNEPEEISISKNEGPLILKIFPIPCLLVFYLLF